MAPIRRLTCTTYKDSFSPLIEATIAFSKDQPTRVISINPGQLDMLKADNRKFAVAVGGETASFYVDYHVYPDNQVLVNVSDEPIEPDWWVNTARTEESKGKG